MDKFFTTVGIALKYTKDKTIEGVNHLRTPPKEVQCVNCPYVVLIPPEIFDWACTFCGANNSWDKSQCGACQITKPSAPSAAPTVTCTMCRTVNEVPTSNAMKGLIVAGRTTKKYAVKAAEVTKEAYQQQVAVPKVFACEHCGKEIDNPNCQTENKSDEAAMSMSSMICPTCQLSTSVAGMEVSNTFRKLGSAVIKGSSKVFFTVSGAPFIECPTCKNPCELPKKAKSDQPPAVQMTSSVTVTCSKCAAKVSTTY